MPSYPTCGHKGPTYRCLKLRMADIKHFNEAFYASTDKIQQDCFLLKYMEVRQPVRDRHSKDSSSRKGISCKYFINIKGAEKFQIQVCQQTFIHVLDVSRDRIQRIARNFLQTSEMPVENRGGNHKPLYVDKRRLK